MALQGVSMRQLLEAGAHFGHQTHRWNPKMAPYIFGARNGVHILDLSQTVPYLNRALSQLHDVAAAGGRVLFVGTKRQASSCIADAARRSGQYFVNSRWLGGMLTNWRTISQSIKRLKDLDELLNGGGKGLTKKEVLQLTRHRDKLEQSLGGIRNMGGLPDIMVVIDTNKEAIAIAEAVNLGIPVVAVLDSNCDPENIAFPIPGNDDAARAIQLYCDLMADAILAGLQDDLSRRGGDKGAAVDPHIDMPGEEGEAVDTKAERKKSKQPKGKGKAKPGKSEDKSSKAEETAEKADVVEAKQDSAA